MRLLGYVRSLVAAVLLVSTWLLPTQVRAGPRLDGGSAAAHGNQVIAGPQGAVYRYPEGAEVKLAPGAKVHFFKRPQDLRLRRGPLVPTYSVILASGRVEVAVPNTDSPAVLISAPHDAKIIAEHGRLVVMTRDHSLVFANRGGDVVWSRTYAWRPVEPEAVWRVSESHPDGQREPTLEAPALDPSPLYLSAFGVPAVLEGFEWGPVAGARRYHVELSRGDELLWSRPSKSNELAAPITGLQTGQYLLRVVAEDRYGLYGRASVAKRIHVVGLELPAGSHVDPPAAVVLNPESQLRFINADGLLVLHAKTSRSLPATQPIGLGGATEPMTVLLHSEGSADALSLRLIPRKRSAQVRVGPKRLVWPGADAELEVELTRRAGEASDSPPPQLRVTLGVEELDVEWHRDGNRFTARVPPRPGPGPWVLRVQVSDASGIALGRDFLEIEERRSATPRARR